MWKESGLNRFSGRAKNKTKKSLKMTSDSNLYKKILFYFHPLDGARRLTISWIVSPLWWPIRMSWRKHQPKPQHRRSSLWPSPNLPLCLCLSWFPCRKNGNQSVKKIRPTFPLNGTSTIQKTAFIWFFLMQECKAICSTGTEQHVQSPKGDSDDRGV